MFLKIRNFSQCPRLVISQWVVVGEFRKGAFKPPLKGATCYQWKDSPAVAEFQSFWDFRSGCFAFPCLASPLFVLILSLQQLIVLLLSSHHRQTAAIGILFVFCHWIKVKRKAKWRDGVGAQWMCEENRLGRRINQFHRRESQDKLVSLLLIGLVSFLHVPDEPTRRRRPVPRHPFIPAFLFVLRPLHIPEDFLAGPINWKTLSWKRNGRWRRKSSAKLITFKDFSFFTFN